MELDCTHFHQFLELVRRDDREYSLVDGPISQEPLGQLAPTTLVGHRPHHGWKETKAVLFAPSRQILLILETLPDYPTGRFGRAIDFDEPVILETRRHRNDCDVGL